MAIDIVYILGSGSKWADNEIRYSLRSLEKHLLDMGQVFIVGRKPDWMQGVNLIEKDDPHKCKERNIMEKVLAACKDDRVSKRFLFLNDDHFALQDFYGATLPNFRKRLLPTKHDLYRRTTTYRSALLNTALALLQRNLTFFHFDIHTPIIYDKALFPKVMELYDWRISNGYVVKSLYANTLALPHQYMTDLKIDNRLSLEHIKSLCQGRMFFSIGDKGLNEPMVHYLNELYPKKSKFEI